jgi:hypothetical protein
VPKTLRMWLKGLSDKEAKAVWTYFDSTCHAESDVIRVISRSHRSLTRKLCGDKVKKEVADAR